MTSIDDSGADPGPATRSNVEAGPWADGAAARNPGMALEIDWLREVRVNRSAVERRAATIPARRASPATMQWRSGAEARLTGRAPWADSASRSEFQNANALVAMAMTSAIRAPAVPPISQPTPRNRAVIAASIIIVLAWFMRVSSLRLPSGPTRPYGPTPGSGVDI